MQKTFSNAQHAKTINHEKPDNERGGEKAEVVSSAAGRTRETRAEIWAADKERARVQQVYYNVIKMLLYVYIAEIS